MSLLVNDTVLRPVSDADLPFLGRVYASTRAEELAPVPWSEADKAAFCAMQFDAQHHAYRQAYPHATFDVIEVDGQPAGRLYLDRRPRDIRIVDIALLPEHRGRGVGTALVTAVQAEAEAGGRTVSIHVERFNPALAWYRRLGFQVVGATGEVYLLLEWSGEDGLVAHGAALGAEGHEEELEGADGVVVQRPDALGQRLVERPVEQQGEGVATALERGSAQPRHLGQAQVEGAAVVEGEAEHLAGARRERLKGEGLEHRLSGPTLPARGAQGSRNA